MNTEFISSGDYQVTKPNESKKLVALLGTCVGIAIIDKTTNIGGLCHVLLSEPNDPTNVWQPKNYVSTCLPLFVDELLKKGAHRDKLEAVVAGGSLSAPVSNRDLILNVGGNNTTTVFKFLQRHHIPVIESETGGCTGMNLSIIPSSGKIIIEHIQYCQEQKSPDHTITPPSSDNIDFAILGTKPIPQIALKITQLLQEGQYDINDITNELIRDQVLSAKILSFCNSSYFGFKTEIDSIERAIIMLGESHLIESVISTAVNSFFEQQTLGGYALVKGGMFRHSVAVANLAKDVARISGKENQQAAYTAGLLHDIGKVVLDNFLSETEPFFYYSDNDKVNDFIQLEQKYFKIDHQEIGARLAALWKIPANLTEAITYHHTPGKSSKHTALTHIVYLADLIASMFMAGVEIEKIDLNPFEQSMSFLNLTPDAINDIIGQTPWTKLHLM